MVHVQTKKRAGKPVLATGCKIIPVEKIFQLQPPGMWGVLRWKRPYSVIIQREDGSKVEIVIRDRTRTAQLFLVGFGLLGSILLLLMNPGVNQSNKHDL